MSQTLENLSPREFENFAYDLLQASGMTSLVWRTPGADGGRDLEGLWIARDFSGAMSHQRWYIECKRYSQSVDWPTVWKKISYAESNAADFLLIITNNNPSPDCETEINKWNILSRRPTVRVWRGYELARILEANPSVASKYGLVESSRSTWLGVSTVIAEVLKTTQAAYAAQVIDSASLSALEYGAAMAELVLRRADQLKFYGRAVPNIDKRLDFSYDWAEIDGDTTEWDSQGLRAISCSLRHLTASEHIRIELRHPCASLHLIDPRLPLGNAAKRIISEVCGLSQFEMTDVQGNTVRLTQRDWHGE